MHSVYRKLRTAAVRQDKYRHAVPDSTDDTD